MLSTMAMVSPVSRHGIEWRPGELNEKSATRRRLIDSALAHVAARPGNLWPAMEHAIAAAGFAHVAQPDAPEVREMLALASGLGAAFGAVAKATAEGRCGAIDVPLGARGIARIQVPDENPGFTAGRLVDALHLAFAVRDAAALDTLADIPLSACALPGAQVPPHLAHHARALQGVRAGADWTWRELLEALRLADPAGLPPAEAERMAFVASPPVELMYATRRDASPAEFDAALSKLLDAHRHWWSSKTDNRNRDPHGFISLPALALAAVMHDRGHRTAVRSEYLPERVLEGRA